MGKGSLRGVLAVLSLVVLAVSLLSPLSPAETRGRFQRFERALSGDPGYHAELASFWFDPDYAAFLDDVKRRTPESATVAVLVPELPDLYRYQALYRLAPRRVVEERWKDEADYIAMYLTEQQRGPGGTPIRSGELRAR
jgi:hypothetical protein